MTTIHRIHPTPPVRGGFHLDVCHEDPGEVVVYVVGDLDIATTSVLRTCLSDLLDADTPLSTLQVDLSAAAFVDVSGADLLLEAHHRAEELGTTLSLARCNAQLVRLLHLTHVLEVVDDTAATTCNPRPRGLSGSDDCGCGGRHG